MSKYIITRLVEAEPKKMCINIVPTTEHKDGYKITHEDGTTTWSEKQNFEHMSIKVGENNTITQEFVDYLVDNSCMDVQTIDNKTTIVYILLPNGFSMVESSSCVDPNNYDEKIGEEICIEKIKNRLWELLGFMLATAKNGLK